MPRRARNFRAVSAVTGSTLARPRTPSVPKMRLGADMERGQGGVTVRQSVDLNLEGCYRNQVGAVGRIDVETLWGWREDPPG